MQKILLISCVLMLVSACEKDNQTTLVSYRAGNGSSEISLSYRDESGNMIDEKIVLESSSDVWTKSMEFEKGEIVYLSGIYYDSVASLKLEVLIDGKVFKSNNSVNEHAKYVIVSGSIPY